MGSINNNINVLHLDYHKPFKCNMRLNSNQKMVTLNLKWNFFHPQGFKFCSLEPKASVLSINYTDPLFEFFFMWTSHGGKSSFSDHL